MKQKNLKRFSFWMLLAPALIFYASVIIGPIVYSSVLSFFKWNGLNTPEFAGLQNYATVIKDPVFLHGLRNNLLIVVVSILGQIPIGFVIAYFLYRKMVKGASFFQGVIFLPITISVVVVAILWNQMFSTSGILTVIVRHLTDNPRFVFTIFESKNYAIFPILLVILWMYTGTYMIIFFSSFQKIPISSIEAAIIEGSTEWQILRHIIFPASVHVIFTNSIFAITGSLKSFGLIFAMTSGGPAYYTTVIAIYMYITTFKYYKYGLGSAISIIIVLLSVCLILILKHFCNKLEKRYN